MSRFNKPVMLAILPPEHKEIDGHQYSIAPLLGRLVLHKARGYAERIAAIKAADTAHSLWARELIPEFSRRTELARAAYDATDDKKIDAASARIAQTPSRMGSYVLAIGLFDNHAADPHNPSNMIGYVEASLQTNRHNQLIDTYVRSRNPERVFPSLGHGVFLYPGFSDSEASLTDWMVNYTARSFNPAEIGAAYADSLDVTTCQENTEALSWLTAYGSYDVFPSDAPSVMGETPITVRFKSLKNVVKTT